jgi:uncharacterized protein YegP (UPF0339 family)
MWFELYQDSCQRTDKRWRWRLIDEDGAVLALAARGYSSEKECCQQLSAISASTPVKFRSNGTHDCKVKQKRRQR